MDYTIGRRGMISGQGEAMDHTYFKIEGNDGRLWFVAADVPNAGDYVYCTAYKDPEKTGEGFAGAHLPLKLHDGTEFTLKGGWHSSASGLKVATTRSNPQSFLEATGVDVTQKHLTFVVIGRDRVHPKNSWDTIVRDVLYIDPEGGQIGSFHRGEYIAMGIARALNVPVMLYSQSQGGSSSHFVKPDDKPKDWWEGNSDPQFLLNPLQDDIVRS